MIEKVICDPNQDFHWIDIIDPSHQEVESIALEYGLHPTSVQDCLDPEHLPKFEKIDNITFIIFRTYDEKSVANADTVQELTRKLAIFFTDKFLITIHRKDQPYLEKVRNRWKNIAKNEPNSVSLSHIVNNLIREIFASFEKPIDHSLRLLEEYEMKIFGKSSSSTIIQEGYYLKRQASVYKRILRLSIDVLNKLSHNLFSQSVFVQDLKEEAESLYFYAEELQESMASLLNFHITLSSHYTNEVVRVLTLFSVFFMPLNFIASIYGMNFEHMPELKWLFGYPMVLVAMLLISLCIFLWFKTKGWLKN